MIEARFEGHICESAVTIVVKECISMHAGDEDIRKAIIVIISDSDADVISCSGKSGGLSYVGERRIAIVPEEAIAIFGRVLSECGDVRTVGKEDVRVPIAVVIQNGDSTAHRFWCITGTSLVILKNEGKFLKYEANSAGICFVLKEFP